MSGNSRLPRGAFVVRPDRATARAAHQAGKGAALASALALACGGIAFGLKSGGWLFGAGVFGGGALLLGQITLYFRNASVFASETKFGKTTSFGRLRSRDRSRLARVVLARVAYTKSGEGRPEMYFLDKNGKVLLLVKGTGWPPEKLALLWHHLGVVPEGSFARATTVDKVSRTVPVAWIRRWASLVAVFVMLVFVFGVTILLAHFGIHFRR